MYNNTTLGNLIDFLATLEPDAVITDGFDSAHSDRGSYNELAFSPITEKTTAGKMLEIARSADGEAFTGWKGGSFRMNRNTPVYLGEYGDCGDPITPLTFKYWALTSALNAHGEEIPDFDLPYGSYRTPTVDDINNELEVKVSGEWCAAILLHYNTKTNVCTALLLGKDETCMVDCNTCRVKLYADD